MSGTIAELTDNSIGAGSAYHAKVLLVRVLGHCGGYVDIADGIRGVGGHVAGIPDNTHLVLLISMSLGRQRDLSSDVTGIAIADAISRGYVVVAAGNSNGDTANFSPVSCPGAIVAWWVFQASGRSIPITAIRWRWQHSKAFTPTMHQGVVDAGFVCPR